jgi:hypothetical protein
MIVSNLRRRYKFRDQSALINFVLKEISKVYWKSVVLDFLIEILEINYVKAIHNSLFIKNSHFSVHMWNNFCCTFTVDLMERFLL